MTELALIPGYANGVISLFNSKKGPELSFLAFKSHVASKKAAVFYWNCEKIFGFWASFNLRDHISVYHTDKALAANEKTIEALHAFLQEHKPSVILCHSMGCWLFLNYSEKYSIPDSVQMIIFVQADFSHNKNMPERLVDKITQKKIVIRNYFCSWDITLGISSLVNFYKPAGLVGWKNSLVENIFFPLLDKNIHTGSISDKKFAAIVEGAIVKE